MTSTRVRCSEHILKPYSHHHLVRSIVGPTVSKVKLEGKHLAPCRDMITSGFEPDSGGASHHRTVDLAYARRPRLPEFNVRVTDMPANFRSGRKTFRTELTVVLDVNDVTWGTTHTPQLY
jgi:hypothetical protein